MISAADTVVAKHAAAVVSKSKSPKANKIPESLPKSALSLRPNEEVMMAAAFGNEYACAIRDAWKFNLPIIEISAEEYERSQQDRVVFIG